MVSAFLCGFFYNKHWELKLDLECHESMRAVVEYEAKYINVAGYLCAFNRTAMALRTENLRDRENEDALRCNVWCNISVRFALRVLGLCSEFCTMAAEDPTHAKLELPALKKRGHMAAADDLDEPLQ